MFEDDNRYSDAESAHSNYSTTVKKKKKTKSGKQKTRQCKYCDKILTTKAALKLHEKSHTSEKLKPAASKFSCEDCGMEFNRAYHLSKHRQECEKAPKDIEDNADPSDDIPLAQVKTEIEEQEELEQEGIPDEIPKLRLKKEPEETKLHPCKVCKQFLIIYLVHISIKHISTSKIYFFLSKRHFLFLD